MTENLFAPFIVVLFIVALGLYLFSGRGAWLVAGYNTMPKKKRERYDGRALSRFTGKLMFAVAGCIALIIAGDTWSVPGLQTAGIIWLVIAVVFALVYANTGNRFVKKP